MAFNIYDESLTRVGEIRTVISSTWEEKFADKGICQLVVANSEAASRLLLPGRFVGKNDKSTLWQIKTKEKREGELWINGFTANYSLLDDRVYDGIHTSNVVADDLRAAVIGKRAPGIVALAADRGLTGSVVSEHTYPTLFELSKDLCGSVDYGFRFVHDRAAKKLLFDVFAGQEQSNAKFSEAFGNLANLVLQQSDADFKNVAFVGGEGEGSGRIFVVCGDTTAEGLARHELFVDARDLRKENGQTQTAYEDLLKERGLQKLNEHNGKLSVTFDVDPADFGTAYSLGDTVCCILPEDGLKLFVRVIAFEETIEDNRTALSLTIGTPVIQTIGGNK